ncbi:MAG: cell surface protein SprA [Bacteroidetes bacterium]|nr:cell surface protein SprA [Bacteroidota bacterium]
MLYGSERNKCNAGSIRPFPFLLAGIFLFFLAESSGLAQVNNNDTIKLPYPFTDEIRYPFSTSGIYSPLILGNPANVESKVVFDPVTNQYVFSETVGKINFRPPSSMSMKEYLDYDTKTSMSDYWIQKARESAEGKTSPLLANFQLGETFDKIFGTDAINIIPQGSAELIFGYNVSYTENPALSERNRSNGSFIFKEKIQMNVTGTIGDKMQVGINYNTEATFDFENKTKLEYTGKEDEIIKKIEAGNVSFNVPGTLISGSQSLFGLKTDLQFGKLFVSSVISHQRGQSQVVEVKGGAQVNEFEVNVDEYDANRHFFLSHFFRDNYNDWMNMLPYINSGVRIEQIEVWITNKTSEFDKDNRNILSLMDLGETYGPDNEPNFFGDPQLIQPQQLMNAPVSNEANNLYSTITNQYDAIRDFKSIAETLKGLEQAYGFYSGKDFEKLENARRLKENEYTLNRELGYISLNSSLRSDEVLAVSYVYTYRGKTYQVGELSTGGVSYPKTLVVKLLKGTSLTPKLGTWDLMMKNVYSLGAYQVSQQDFVLDVLYRKDETGVPVNFIAENSADSAFNNQILLKVLNLDNLDSRNEPNPDGRFDFVEGVTIIARDGRVFLPQLEPFGSDMRKTITGGDVSKNKIADKYVFEELYDSTQTKARLISKKNKFFLAGSYQSSSSSEIQLNAMNVPRGSVKVTAGGIALIEGQDYTVDYTLGRVKILNQGYIESGTPIQISLENNALFNLQTKTLMGTHLDYKFSDNFTLGGTLMHLTERPLTQKVNMGDEPISNTIWGLNANYRTDSRLLTTLVDKLPFIETKEISSVALDAEFAHLIPGQANVIGGEAYVDDFEGTETTIELKSYPAWFLASTPRRIPGSTLLNDLEYGYQRAKLAWYVIDPLFTRSTSQTPDNINIKETQSDPFVREVLETEIYKNRQSGTGFDNPLSVLNLAYFPQERGPYCYNTGDMNPDGTLKHPEDKWGGIMREIQISDFENANVEYIEFWLMDPFVKDSLHTGGDLYFDLGEISEDILKDSWKMFENGLPATDSITLVDTTVWGRVPTTQAIVNAFDADPGHRKRQDVGLDGLNTEEEFSFFKKSFIDRLESGSTAYNKALADPSNDDFKYFLDTYYDDAEAGVIERYKQYNNVEGNSPTTEQSEGDFADASTLPNTEDINHDNTLNETEAYFEYHAEIRPGEMNFDNPYIADIIAGDNVNWYLFRIPISEYESKVGNIDDFKSIRFMRMYLTGFTDSVIMRFAELHLVRAEWRKYQYDVAQGSPSVNEQYTGSDFEVAAVNIEENSSKYPVNYILPPGIDRVIDPSQPQLTELNEQSILLKVNNLADADARVVFKNTDLDFRQYKTLKMFVHAEQIPDEIVKDYDITAFLRIGSDQVDNYYEYEVPLKLTPLRNDYNDDEREIVWPDENLFEINLDDLVEIKKERDKAEQNDPFLYSKTKVYQKNIKKNKGNTEAQNRIKVKGTPNLGNIRSVVLGVRNSARSDNPYPDDGMPKSVEVWFNELRLTDFNNHGGWAANARLQTRLADLATVSMAGATSKPGFGSIEQKVDQRNKEETSQYDISSNIELGKMFPEKSKVSIPLFVGASHTTINPEYYPKEPDRLLKEVLGEAKTEEERKEIKEISQDYLQRNSINLTNIRVNKELKKWRIFSPANFSLSAAYNESKARSYKIEKNNIIQYRLGFNYVYNARPKSIAPFTKAKKMKSPYLRFVKDFNFSPYPSRFTFRTNLDRNYNEIKLRNVYEDRLIKVDSTVTKDFIWDRYYDLAWDLSRSLKFDFSASNTSRIDEIQGAYDFFREGEHEEWSKSVWASMSNGGRPIIYTHTLNATYNVPLNKFPILAWTSLSLRYSASVEWNQGPLFTDGQDLGNTISNTGTYQVNSQFNLGSLYSKVKYLKNLESKYSTTGKKQDKEQRYKTIVFKREDFFVKGGIPKNIMHKLKTQDVQVKVTNRQGNEVKVNVDIVDENRISITADTNMNGLTVTIEGKVKAGTNPFVYIGENTVRFLTGLKNVSITYSNTGATIMEGYNPDANIMGFSTDDISRGAPGLPFLLGYQDKDVALNFAGNNWLTQDSTFSDPYILTKNENLNIRGTFEPFKGFRIEISGLRTYSEHISEYFYYNGAGYDFSNRMKSGNYSISIISLGTAFEKLSDENSYASANFDKMKEYRKLISKRLYGEVMDQNAIGYTGLIQQRVEPGYADGYGSTSPEVMVPSFLAAYTGRDPEKITLDPFPGYWYMMPNWRLSIDGLTNFKALTSWMKSASITHSYRSTYNVNSFTTNFDFEADENGIGYIRDYQNNFIPELLFNAVSITEQFSPLAGVDITWVNSLITRFEMKKSRTLALSLSNNQITESRNNEWVIGSGYRFKEVPLKFGEKAFESDLNIRIDLSIRDNKTVIRNLVQSIDLENAPEATTGQNIFKLNFTADYVLTPRFNVQLFFDRTVNKPYTSRSFLTADTNVGFSLRFALSQ